MQLDRTKELIHQGADLSNPLRGLTHALGAALELVSLPDNDFVWSGWDSAGHAKDEIQSLIDLAQSGVLPERLTVVCLFGPTGPLQEVSISSGWGETFLAVAQRFDEIEKLLWPSK